MRPDHALHQRKAPYTFMTSHEFCSFKHEVCWIVDRLNKNGLSRFVGTDRTLNEPPRAAIKIKRSSLDPSDCIKNLLYAFVISRCLKVYRPEYCSIFCVCVSLARRYKAENCFTVTKFKRTLSLA